MNRIGDNLVHFGPNERLVRSLIAARVRFVVVGGLAVAWHCIERQADDMDLLVEPTKENSVNIFNVLVGLGVVGHSAESFTKLGLQAPLKSIFYAELMTPKPDEEEFSSVEASAVDAKLFGMPVRLASIETLLRMKEIAVRSTAGRQDKHLRDIELLKLYAV